MSGEPGDAGDPRGGDGECSAGRRTVLRLGALLGAAPDRWISRWHDRHPEVRLQLDHFDESGQLERIHARTVDIGYLRVAADAGPVVDTEVFHRVWLYREEAVVCAARDHWIAAAEESVTGEDIAEETFLDPEDVAAYAPEEAGSGEGGIARAERMTMEVVASGAGVLVLPRSAARALSRKDVITRRIEDHPGYDVGLGWLRACDDPVIQEFIGVTRGRRADSARSGLDADSGQKRRPRRTTSGNGPGARAGSRTAGASGRRVSRGRSRRSGHRR